MMLMVKTLLALVLISLGIYSVVLSFTVLLEMVMWGFLAFLFGSVAAVGGFIWSTFNTVKWVKIAQQKDEYKSLEHQHQMRLLKMRHAEIETAAGQDIEAL